MICSKLEGRKIVWAWSTPVQPSFQNFSPRRFSAACPINQLTCLCLELQVVLECETYQTFGGLIIAVQGYIVEKRVAISIRNSR